MAFVQYLNFDGTDLPLPDSYEVERGYGEGVDRMYNELESAGLHEPEYFSNAFILQTVIYNIFLH